MADCDKPMRQTQKIDMLGTTRLGARCAIVKALASAANRGMSHPEAPLKHITPSIVNATQQRACMTLLFLHHKRLLILQAPASSSATPRRRTEGQSCHLRALWLLVLSNTVDFGILDYELIRIITARILCVEFLDTVRARLLGIDRIPIVGDYSEHNVDDPHGLHTTKLPKQLKLIVCGVASYLQRQLLKLQLGDRSYAVLLPGILVEREFIKLELGSRTSTIPLPGIIIDVGQQLFDFAAGIYLVELCFVELFVSSIANLELNQRINFKQRDCTWIFAPNLLVFRAAVHRSEQLDHHLPNKLPVPDCLLGELQPGVASAVQQLFEPNRSELQHDAVLLLASDKPGDDINDSILFDKHDLLDHRGDDHFLRCDYHGLPCALDDCCDQDYSDLDDHLPGHGNCTELKQFLACRTGYLWKQQLLCHQPGLVQQQQQLAREHDHLQLAATLQRKQHDKRSGLPNFVPSAAYYRHRHDNYLHHDLPSDKHLHVRQCYAYEHLHHYLDGDQHLQVYVDGDRDEQHARQPGKRV
ncbi:hypothetical protein LTR29_012133 [Friedmanniomyces endolithicus]|nr:hypothetical protein LTR29_012133 [Friedmanniomyces endolithicus]